MVKKLFPLLLLPMFVAGCASTLTNLTPTQQTRNPDNTYPVEVALNSRQQTMRWDSIKPQVVVGNEVYPMRLTPLMTNRWEGLIPVPRDTKAVRYHYKFEYLNNAFGGPLPNSVSSPEYTLRILDQ